MVAVMHELETLSATLGKALKTKGLQLALAESCTGGMIAQAITAIAGSSGWFDRGFVTYSNEAKMEMLGVPETLIHTHGAVSEQVAQAMAVGALQHSLANISASVTGIAGPSGGSVLKPVGMVCFGWAINLNNAQPEKLLVETRYFDGDRAEIRQQAASYSLAGLLKLIKETS
jgi:nicotinamide-nucleotide amidase